MAPQLDAAGAIVVRAPCGVKRECGVPLWCEVVGRLERRPARHDYVVDQWACAAATELDDRALVEVHPPHADSFVATDELVAWHIHVRRIGDEWAWHMKVGDGDIILISVVLRACANTWSDVHIGCDVTIIEPIADADCSEVFFPWPCLGTEYQCCAGTRCPGVIAKIRVSRKLPRPRRDRCPPLMHLQLTCIHTPHRTCHET